MTGGRDLRLLLADVDGTLVTKDKVLTPAARTAVQALRDAGVDFGITSSRPPQGLRMLIEPLDLKIVIAGLNGGLYAKPDLNGPNLPVVERHKLDPATATKTVELLSDKGLDVWIYTDDDWLVRQAAAPHVARETWILQFNPTVVPAFTPDHLARAIKIVGVSDDHALVAACEKLARAALGEAASAARSEAHFLDVTNPDANKGAVVLTLAKLLNISPIQIATIGDMQNDVLMFKTSGLSIAMGNASDEVKAQATHVTDTNDNDGFAKAVQQFVLGARAS
jgi:Cof subfamily protein (haloacid dehalogenase superfamily)